jgi:predicted permease
MIGWFQDLRYASRQLRKSPSFTIVAVLTLAVAIGANAVAFGALDAIVLRSVDVPNPQNLFVLGRANDNFGYESYPNYLDLRDRNHSFEALAANNIAQAGLDTGEGPTRVWGYEASGNYFDVMGLQPYLGRFFHASDEHGANSAPYIVLTYAYWHTAFHDDRGVVGRTVQLNKHPFTIIGVVPAGFHGTFPAFTGNFFVPIVNQELVEGQNQLNQRGTRWVSEMIGRLKPGVTPVQAVSDINAIGSELQKSYPKDLSKMAFALSRPGMADVFGGALKAFLAGLMLLAGLILLAACANLGSLFAARAADRSREVALRLALGSSRVRILRGLFTEALLISLMGGSVGLWCSVMLLRRLSVWQPFPQFPLHVPVSPDARVYTVALVLAIVSGLLFGIVPVRQVLRANPYEVVKAGSFATVGRKLTVRDALLVVQIAICAVLITSSIVAVRGLARSLHSNFGFEPNNVMLAETDPGMAGYSGDKVPALQKQMLDAMQTIPGIATVALVDSPPLHMGWTSSIVFSDQATDLRPVNAAAETIIFKITPDYFSAAGTAVISGRQFTWHDDKNSPRVAVINQIFAHKVFGSTKDAIGHYFKMKDGTLTQVVGVAEDGKYTANLAEDPQPAMFLPILQAPANDTWLLIRSDRDSQQLAAAIRAKLHELDPGLPSFIQTWNQGNNGALFAPRVATVSLGVLGMMGAILSITGIFGMAAYSVSKRLREFGIRIALGAQRNELLKAALGRAFKVLVFGSVTGLVLGILASRVLASIVYQATPRDPLVLAGAVLAMSLLGLLATWVPAQRALSIDPMILLREE